MEHQEIVAGPGGLRRFDSAGWWGIAVDFGITFVGRDQKIMAARERQPAPPEIRRSTEPCGLAGEQR
jgi:hypothetical protein